MVFNIGALTLPKLGFSLLCDLCSALGSASREGPYSAGISSTLDEVRLCPMAALDVSLSWIMAIIELRTNSKSTLKLAIQQSCIDTMLRTEQTSNNLASLVTDSEIDSNSNLIL